MMKKLLPLLLCLLLLTGCAPKVESLDIFAMDTYMSLVAVGDEAFDALQKSANIVNSLEQSMSRTIDSSDVAQLNATGSAALRYDTAVLLEEAIALSNATLGCFDVTIAPLVALWNISGDNPRVPAQEEIDALLPLVGSEHIHLNGGNATLDEGCAIDLGGIAKGYIADRLKEYLVEQGVTSALIDLGGNILCIGSKPDGTPFRVGIREPFAPQGTSIEVIAVEDLSVVTSGVYERCFTENDVLYHHLLDPKAGYPFRTGLNSVSIISGTSVDGDALSTVCFALGIEKGMELINSMPDVYAIFVTENNELVYSEGMEAFVAK